MTVQVLELLLIGLLAGAFLGLMLGFLIGSAITRSHFTAMTSPQRTTNHLNSYARPRRVMRYGDDPVHYE